MCEGWVVIVLVKQQQLELGGGAEGAGATVTCLYGDCVILLLLTVKDLCAADNTCVAVDGEAASVVLSYGI